MHRTNIYLDAEQCEQLDRLAAQEGTSRAEVVRRLLARGIEGDARDLAGDLEAIECAFGVLADVDIRAPHRERDERAAHLERVRRASE